MIYAIVVVLVLIADQAVKLWTTQNIALSAVGDECAKLIPGVVHMTNVHNYGAAFSILQNARWPLVAVTLVFIVVIVVLINREVIHTKFGRWTAALVLAGAVGNCIDRILYGYVVDMFEFEFFSFPVFNVADIFITVCGILFCIHVIVYREPEEVKKANESEVSRRMREQKQERQKEKARAAKEDPYAKIPKRGEHKTLEEELRPIDPDDPFAEWEFGAKVKAAGDKSGTPPAEEKPAGPEEDELDLKFNARYKPAREAAQPPETAAEERPAPEIRPEAEAEPESEPPAPGKKREPAREPKEERKNAPRPQRAPEPPREPEPEPEREREPEREAPRGREPEPRARTRRRPEPEPETRRRPSRREYDDYDDEDYGDDYDDYDDGDGYDDQADYDPSGDFSFDYDPSADFDFDTPARPPEKKPEKKRRPSGDISRELDDILSEYGDDF